jgi:hypothetical protein
VERPAKHLERNKLVDSGDADSERFAMVMTQVTSRLREVHEVREIFAGDDTPLSSAN